MRLLDRDSAMEMEDAAREAAGVEMCEWASRTRTLLVIVTLVRHLLGPGGKKSHFTKQADRRRKNKRPAATSSNPSAVDASGMLVDVDVQEIEAPKVIEGPTKDANHFGGKPFLKKGKAGIDKLHRKAETVADPSTFRRHLQKYHKVSLILVPGHLDPIWHLVDLVIPQIPEKKVKIS
ncbi:hypothetical protein B0H14DRAFT_2571338 [Mycena olivaceomarginata]|nr:hypothetical protein B0H14DRAFT_2571338 [Mycena olivaceomarginata]